MDGRIGRCCCIRNPFGRMLKLTQSDIHLIAQAVVSMMPVPDEVMTCEQVGELIGKTALAVRVDAQRGLLPAHKRGKAWYFSKNEITAYLTNDEVAMGRV